jgi:hypothetical protein
MKTKIEDYTDDDEILRDGESVRTPMMLMDSVQRAVASTQVGDAYALHKPGYRYAQSELTRDAADADDDPRDAAYADLCQRLTDGWLGPRSRSPYSTRRRPTKKETDEGAAVRLRDAAFAERLAYLKDAYREPFRDALMQEGYHPMIRLEYQRRDQRGPKAEVGGPDSEAAYQASKIAASNAWRLPSNALNLPFAPQYQRYDPSPQMGPENERKIAEAKARIAEANDRKQKLVGVAREDYIRRTRTAWDPTAATGIEAQREKWLGK